MTSSEAIKMCDEYLSSLDNEKARRLLKSSNMLCRHTLMNRVLIDIQDTQASDVRTREEWFIIGRKVRDKGRPIALMIASSMLSYIDTSTGKTLKSGDLTQDEIEMAERAGIIKRDEKTAMTRIVFGYDYRDTDELEDNKYRRSIEPGFFMISKICMKLYGIQFTVDTLDKRAGVVCVPKDAVKAINIIVDTIANHCGCNSDALRYAMYDMLGVESSNEFDVNISELDSVQEVMRCILKQYLIALGYTEQAREDIKNVEDSKQMLGIINYLRSYEALR